MQFHRRTNWNKPDCFKWRFGEDKMKTDLVVAGFIIKGDKVLLIHHNKLQKWLPFGGHIEENETPDEALIREAKEEVGLEIEILNKKSIKEIDRIIIEQLAVPFHVDVHDVGNHNHCCLFYVCKPKEEKEIKIKKDEISNYKWINKEEIESFQITPYMKQLIKKAFELTENVN